MKLSPDPGETFKAVGSGPLPDTKILTLLRRPDLSNVFGSGGWRVHSIRDRPPTLEGLPVQP
jgi:hypothetical protein